MSRIILVFSCILSFVLVSCSKSGGSSKSDVTDESRYSESVPGISSEPESLDDYALYANGEIEIKGKIETDGPLADISSTSDVSIGDSSGTLTGVISTENTKKITGLKTDNIGRKAISKAQSKMVFKSVSSETGSEFTGYKFNSDGTIKRMIEGVSESASNNVFDSAFVFRDSKWHLVKNSAVIDEPMAVETDLIIEGDNSLWESPLYVAGSLSSNVPIEIDVNDPFKKCIVVDGNMSIADASIVGKVEVFGDIVINGSVDIIGTIKTDKSLTIAGDIRINYLDAIYKAALGNAQSELAETMMAHSQVFKDLNGKDAFALFTFSRGYKQTNESIIMGELEDGTIVKEDYYSTFMGSSLEYGTALGGEDGLSVYYSNKLYVEKYLQSKGYTFYRVSEALYVPADSLYLSYRDESNNIIGTYQVYGGGLVYNQSTPVVELTVSQREILKEYVQSSSNDESLIDKITKLISGNDKTDKILRASSNVLTDEELAAMGIDSDDVDKKAAELRVDEWRDSKSLVESEIEAEVLVPDDEDSADVSKSDVRKVSKIKKRRAWKKIKKNIKKYVRIFLDPLDLFETETEIKCIDGVSSNENNISDLWHQNVYLRNPTGDCGPISGAMILIWNDVRRDVSPDMDLTAYRSSNAILDPANKIPWINKYKGQGTYAYDLDDVLNQMMYDLGISGSASWEWQEFSSTPLVRPDYSIVMNRLVYEDFCKQVRINQPAIVGMYGLTTWPKGNDWDNFKEDYKKAKIDHYMPVIGYKTVKRKFAGIDLVIFDKTYLYTDTTWGYKAYYRFDWYSTPFNFRSMVKMNVNDSNKSPLPVILNGGFESGNSFPDNWIKWASTSTGVCELDTSIKHSGSKSAVIRNPANVHSVWAQTIKGLSPNRKFKIEGWIKTKDLDPASEGAYLFMLFYDIDSNLISVLAIDERIKGTTDWTRVEKAISVPAGAVEMTLEARVIDSSGTAWFDDIRFIE